MHSTNVLPIILYLEIGWKQQNPNSHTKEVLCRWQYRRYVCMYGGVGVCSKTLRLCFLWKMSLVGRHK